MTLINELTKESWSGNFTLRTRLLAEAKTRILSCCINADSQIKALLSSLEEEINRLEEKAFTADGVIKLDGSFDYARIHKKSHDKVIKILNALIQVANRLNPEAKPRLDLDPKQIYNELRALCLTKGSSLYEALGGGRFDITSEQSYINVKTAIVNIIDKIQVYVDLKYSAAAPQPTKAEDIKAVAPVVNPNAAATAAVAISRRLPLLQAPSPAYSQGAATGKDRKDDGSKGNSDDKCNIGAIAYSFDPPSAAAKPATAAAATSSVTMASAGKPKAEPPLATLEAKLEQWRSRQIRILKTENDDLSFKLLYEMRYLIPKNIWDDLWRFFVDKIQNNLELAQRTDIKGEEKNVHHELFDHLEKANDAVLFRLATMTRDVSNNLREEFAEYVLTNLEKPKTRIYFLVLISDKIFRENHGERLGKVLLDCLNDFAKPFNATTVLIQVYKLKDIIPAPLYPAIANALHRLLITPPNAIDQKADQKIAAHYVPQQPFALEFYRAYANYQQYLTVKQKKDFALHLPFLRKHLMELLSHALENDSEVQDDENKKFNAIETWDAIISLIKEHPNAFPNFIDNSLLTLLIDKIDIGPGSETVLKWLFELRHLITPAQYRAIAQRFIDNYPKLSTDPIDNRLLSTRRFNSVFTLLADQMAPALLSEQRQGLLNIGAMRTAKTWGPAVADKKHDAIITKRRSNSLQNPHQFFNAKAAPALVDDSKIDTVAMDAIDGDTADDYQEWFWRLAICDTIRMQRLPPHISFEQMVVGVISKPEFSLTLEEDCDRYRFLQFIIFIKNNHLAKLHQNPKFCELLIIRIIRYFNFWRQLFIEKTSNDNIVFPLLDEVLVFLKPFLTEHIRKIVLQKNLMRELDDKHRGIMRVHTHVLRAWFEPQCSIDKVGFVITELQRLSNGNNDDGDTKVGMLTGTSNDGFDKLDYLRHLNYLLGLITVKILLITEPQCKKLIDILILHLVKPNHNYHDYFNDKNMSSVAFALMQRLIPLLSLPLIEYLFIKLVGNFGNPQYADSDRFIEILVLAHTSITLKQEVSKHLTINLPVPELKKLVFSHLELNVVETKHLNPTANINRNTDLKVNTAPVIVVTANNSEESNTPGISLPNGEINTPESPPLIARSLPNDEINTPEFPPLVSRSLSI